MESEPGRLIECAYRKVQPVAPNKTPMSTDERETPTVDEQRAPGAQSGGSIVRFWIAAWLGTVAAGSTFGGLIVGFALLAGGPGGNGSGWVYFFGIALFFGAVYAGLVAIPIHVTIAILTWAFWLNRFRLATAAIAGALTGVVATMSVFPFPNNESAVIAGSLGTIGAAVVGSRHIKRQANQRPTVVTSKKTVWQFTIRDLLVRMTLLAMLLSAWTCYFTVVRNVEEREQQRYREYQEESEQSADDAPRDGTAPDATPLESDPPAAFQPPEFPSDGEP